MRSVTLLTERECLWYWLAIYYQESKKKNNPIHLSFLLKITYVAVWRHSTQNMWKAESSRILGGLPNKNPVWHVIWEFDRHFRLPNRSSKFTFKSRAKGDAHIWLYHHVAPTQRRRQGFRLAFHYCPIWWPKAFGHHWWRERLTCFLTFNHPLLWSHYAYGYLRFCFLRFSKFEQALNYLEMLLDPSSCWIKTL